MNWRTWFGTVEVRDLSDAQEAFLSELGRMLVSSQPVELDPAASSVRSEGHGLTLKKAIEVRLVHRQDPDLSVEIGVGLDEGWFAWLSAHQHVYADDEPLSGVPWPTRLVIAIAALLAGDFEVMETYRGDRLISSSIIDVADPNARHVIGTPSSLFFWLRRHPSRTVTRRVNFGVQNP